VHILKTLSDEHGLPTFLGQTADGENVRVREVAPVLIASADTREAIVARIHDLCAVRHARLLPTTLVEDGARLRVMEPKPDTLTVADWLIACERLEMRPAPKSILHVARGIGTALRCLHAFPSKHAPGQCVLHWALNPQNVHIQRDGGVLLGGFGLLPPLHRGVKLNGTAQARRFAFLAPEQTYTGQPLDRPTDLFSFGVLLLELITGVSPFEGHNVLETVKTTRRARWDALTQTAVHLSPELGDVLPALLELNPKRRWQSATDFLEALAPSEAIGVERDTLLADIEHLFEARPTPPRPDFVPHLTMCPLPNGPASSGEHAAAQAPFATIPPPEVAPMETTPPCEVVTLQHGQTIQSVDAVSELPFDDMEADTLLDSLHDGFCGEDDPTEEILIVPELHLEGPPSVYTSTPARERTTALMIGLYLGTLALLMGAVLMWWVGAP